MPTIRILYKRSANKDLKRIDRQHRIRLMDAIENKLASHPAEGKQLKGSYRGLFSLRVGDYRVIYAMIADGLLILRVAHRKEVYET